MDARTRWLFSRLQIIASNALTRLSHATRHVSLLDSNKIEGLWSINEFVALTTVIPSRLIIKALIMGVKRRQFASFLNQKITRTGMVNSYGRNIRTMVLFTVNRFFLGHSRFFVQELEQNSRF